MKVYAINTPSGRKFYANDVKHLKVVPVGSTISVRSMTVAEYNCVPATVESAAFFRR